MVYEPRQDGSGVVRVATPAMHHGPVAIVTLSSDPGYRADHACLVFDDPEGKAIAVLQAIRVQQCPGAGTLHCRRRPAGTEIEQAAGHQSQVPDAWPRCGQVPVQQTDGRAFPEDYVARGDVTVTDNLTALGQRCSGSQVMQSPDQGHHRLKWRALSQPVRCQAAMADIARHILQDLPAILVHAPQPRASAEVMSGEKTQKLMHVT
jgi:hypothetical protein